MASQMLCCMISTKLEINLFNLANPHPFHPSLRRRCSAPWSPQNQKSINPTQLILALLIYYGVADALLNNQRDIINQSIDPTLSLPISSIMASQMLCCMISTMSLASCSVASSRSSILARASVSRIRLSSCLCTQKKICRSGSGTFYLCRSGINFEYEIKWNNAFLDSFL